MFSVHSQRLSGTISFAPKESGPFSITVERPFKMREEMVYKGKKIVRILNGNKGWIINPLTGNDEAQPLPESIVENMRGAADIDGPLVDYQMKGNVLHLMGKDTVDGRTAYKIRVIQKKNIISYIYIDRITGLELKWEGEVGDKGNERMMQSIFSNYRRVHGIMYACDIISGVEGAPAPQHIIINKVEVNPKLDLKLFEKPDAAGNQVQKKAGRTKDK